MHSRLYLTFSYFLVHVQWGEYKSSVIGPAFQTKISRKIGFKALRLGQDEEVALVPSTDPQLLVQIRGVEGALRILGSLYSQWTDAELDELDVYRTGARRREGCPYLPDRCHRVEETMSTVAVADRSTTTASLMKRKRVCKPVERGPRYEVPWKQGLEDLARAGTHDT